MRKTRTPARTLSLPLRLIYIRYAGFIWSGISVLLIFASVAFSGKTDALRIQLADLSAPLLANVSRPFVALSDNINDMTGISALRAENIRLTAENHRLQEWYQTALKLQAENRSLRAFLNVATEPERAYLTTRVMSDPGGRFIKSFLVPTGNEDGVENGQAVITEDGLIGRIVNTGDNAARILLITDLNSRIPVMVEQTHHRAILAGDNTEILSLNHLPSDSGVEIGARIVTSGHDGILPPNIPIGIVSAVTPDKISVVPLSDMDGIHFIRIIATAPDAPQGYFIDRAPQ